MTISCCTVGVLERVSACSPHQPVPCSGGVHCGAACNLFRSPGSPLGCHRQHIIEYVAFLACFPPTRHVSAASHPGAGALALLELHIAPNDIPHTFSTQHHLWFSAWLPFAQRGMLQLFVGKQVDALQSHTSCPHKVVALLFPAMCQVPFAIHMPMAVFGAVMGALLTSSANGTCDMLCKVASASGSCSRLLGLFNSVGDAVHEVLWQYSSAMGFVLNKVRWSIGLVMHTAGGGWLVLHTHAALSQVPAAQGLQACALASVTIHLVCLVAVTSLLYHREVKMRVDFLVARGWPVVDGLSSVYTLRCVTALASAALHALVLLDVLVF